MNFTEYKVNILSEGKTITLKTAKIALDGIAVKKERKVIAKIYPPNDKRKEFQIEMNGLAFFAKTLKDALDVVRKKEEDFMSSFGGNVKVVIK